MGFKLVIFDCDGTLVASEFVNNSIISQTLRKIGLEKYDINYCLDNFTGHSLPAIINMVNKDLPESEYLSEEEMMVHIRRMSELMSHDIKAVENADFTLERIFHDKCVASNGERHDVLRNLQNTGLIRHFDKRDIFTREQVIMPKPAPDLFIHAAFNKDADASNSLVIEDSAAGVSGAKQAGMTAFGFVGSVADKARASKELRDAGADMIISDLSEIIKLVK